MTDPAPPPRTVLAVDTGGTFTDMLLLRGGETKALKVPSTPGDPAAAILSGIRQLLGPEEAFLLLHGSTVATNALLERSGARVVLVTNRGFEDVLEIGRQNRPQLYALVGHRPPPLVGRDDRIGIGGRLGAGGEELEALDPAELASLPERVGHAESIAVCLLHAYGDGAHEEAVAAALPEDRPISLSSRILPEYREYERTSTTVVNAYVAPVMSGYLGRLEREPGAERVKVMGSDGGRLAVERAAREPVHTVLSGPAGGVVGALHWARLVGREGIVTFDMGGTSTDVSLCPGRPLRTREFAIDGHPVAIPVIDIHTVGAGGGSIAFVDPGGALRVGPESAGAVPGPIAYGRGGERVTVTDAHVWLGRLPSEGFLGGSGSLDRDRIAGPLAALAQRLDLTPDEAAEGILAVAETAMERALRVISVERGFDPRDLALVAFGGAGALHAAGLAERLGLPEALIPPDPGVLSAYGILTAPPTREVSRTVLATPAPGEDDGGLADALDDLARRAVEALSREEGVDPGSVSVERWVDARYRGQSFELRVGAPGWVQAFHDAHEARYGYARREAEVEAVTIRALATGPALDVPAAPLPDGSPPAGEVGSVVVGGRPLDCRRVWRRDLAPGHLLRGPTLILDYSATTWLPPGWSLTVHSSGVLRMVPD